MPALAEVPIQRSLRGVIREEYQEEGDRITAALLADLDSTHLPDEEIADRNAIDKAQLSRIRQGKAHAPARLIAWAIDQGRERHYLRAVCAIGEGEFKPRPPPSVEDRHAAYLAELGEMGLEELLRVRVAKRLGSNP